MKDIDTDEVISTETFSYDAAGNVTGAPDSAFRYDANNRLIEYNGNKVSYDLDGNMLSNGVSAFTYDSANRLISADGHTYTYNAENVRIRNLCENEDTTYTYNTNCRLSKLLCKTANGVTTKYVYGRGLIGEETNSSFKTYHFDFRGSTIAITDVNGTITDTFAYDTYGKCISHTGTSNVIFGYNGRDGVVTDENGFIYMRARYYSPEMKRFVNTDVVAGSISNAVTLNRFAYANGDPVSFVDSYGLSAENGQNLGHSSNYYNRAMALDEKLKHPQSSPTPIEAAYMADHIYGATQKMCGTGYLGEEFGGWELISIYDPLLNEIGLKVGVYQKNINGETFYCLAYAGTNMDWEKKAGGVDSCSDWINNLLQPFGRSPDMLIGIKFAKDFKKLHPDASITIIGHSKGGAEAAAAAVATNSNSILFNPATVFLRKYGLDSNDYTADMMVYVVEGEILNEIFGGISTPIDGFQYLYIEDAGIIEKHSMNAVISALEAKKSERK